MLFYCDHPGCRAAGCRQAFSSRRAQNSHRAAANSKFKKLAAVAAVAGAAMAINRNGHSVKVEESGAAAVPPDLSNAQQTELQPRATSPPPVPTNDCETQTTHLARDVESAAALVTLKSPPRPSTAVAGTQTKEIQALTPAWSASPRASSSLCTSTFSLSTSISSTQTDPQWLTDNSPGIDFIGNHMLQSGLDAGCQTNSLPTDPFIANLVSMASQTGDDNTGVRQEVSELGSQTDLSWSGVFDVPFSFEPGREVASDADMCSLKRKLSEITSMESIMKLSEITSMGSAGTSP